jgi:signal transduction histidine kinase
MVQFESKMTILGKVPITKLRSITRALPLFLTLYLILLIFLAGICIFAKITLQDYCSKDVSVRLEKYLQERSTGALTLKGSKRKSGGLHGLSFVRLISDNEQFLYAESHDFKVDFRGVVDLDPRISVVWISLDDIKKDGSWTVASKELASGLIVQAGMEHSRVVQLYHQLKSLALTAAVIAFFAAGGFSFLSIRRSRSSLKEAERAVSQIVSKQSGGLLDVDDNNELAGLYVLLNNLISQNRQLVREMQESLDNVAHDLRTPMTRLRSVAEYGLQQNSQELLAEALSDCLEESERVLSMLGIMMSVAEAESGTMPLQKTSVQLFDTIQDVINLYEYVADEKNISLNMNIDSDIYITADKTRISQVWANIVDNAIKYGRDSGYVRISAAADKDSVTIFVEDNGMGISASELNRIWERLFRGDRSRSQQGLGLGLSYVRAVVEAHGGEVIVKSTLGEGTCFEVKLPAVEDQGVLQQDSVKVKSQTRGE